MKFISLPAVGMTAFACLALTSPMMAHAQTISMTGTIINLCVLTVTTPGLLAVTGAGTEMSTAQTGGGAATLTVVATGANPTITFSAPGLSGPSSSGAVAEFSYSSSGGASRTLGTGGYVYAMNRLIDSIAVHGRATNSSGFHSGLYTMAATATCAQ